MKENGETNRNVLMGCDCGRTGRDMPFFEGFKMGNGLRQPKNVAQMWACSSSKKPEFYILD